MPYDIKTEVARIRDYYNADPLQKRFSALITGESGSGKTFIARTARFPVHIDSFDPGGTKGLSEFIESGDIVADTSWEKEDPFNPDRFGKWMTETKRRIDTKYFDAFGTYILDSATTWGDAVMNFQMGKRSGEAPNFYKDYVPQKVHMVNYIKLLVNLPCDFILTGHLKTIEEQIGVDKDGNARTRLKYRFLTTGQATVVIPLQFDELYVLVGKEVSGGVSRKMLTDSQGTYLARSRLRSGGKLNFEEEPDIKGLLKKIGLPWEDKAKI